MRRTWIIFLVKQALSAAYDAHSRLSVFFSLLSFLVRRHEPTAIAGADQLAAACLSGCLFWFNRSTYIHASACDYFCLLIRMQNIGSVVLILSSPHSSLLSSRKAESRIIRLGDAPPIDTNMVRTSSLLRATLVATYAALNLHGSSLHF